MIVRLNELKARGQASRQVRVITSVPVEVFNMEIRASKIMVRIIFEDVETGQEYRRIYDPDFTLLSPLWEAVEGIIGEIPGDKFDLNELTGRECRLNTVIVTDKEGNTWPRAISTFPLNPSPCWKPARLLGAGWAAEERRRRYGRDA